MESKEHGVRKKRSSILKVIDATAEAVKSQPAAFKCSRRVSFHTIRTVQQFDAEKCDLRLEAQEEPLHLTNNSDGLKTEAAGMSMSFISGGPTFMPANDENTTIQMTSFLRGAHPQAVSTPIRSAGAPAWVMGDHGEYSDWSRAARGANSTNAVLANIENERANGRVGFDASSSMMLDGGALLNNTNDIFGTAAALDTHHTSDFGFGASSIGHLNYHKSPVKEHGAMEGKTEMLMNAVHAGAPQKMGPVDAMTTTLSKTLLQDKTHVVVEKCLQQLMRPRIDAENDADVSKRATGNLQPPSTTFQHTASAQVANNNDGTELVEVNSYMKTGQIPSIGAAMGNFTSLLFTHMATGTQREVGNNFSDDESSVELGANTCAVLEPISALDHSHHHHNSQHTKAGVATSEEVRMLEPSGLYENMVEESGGVLEEEEQEEEEEGQVQEEEQQVERALDTDELSRWSIGFRGESPTRLNAETTEKLQKLADKLSAQKARILEAASMQERSASEASWNYSPALTANDQQLLDDLVLPNTNLLDLSATQGQHSGGSTSRADSENHGHASAAAGVEQTDKEAGQQSLSAMQSSKHAKHAPAKSSTGQSRLAEGRCLLPTANMSLMPTPCAAVSKQRADISCHFTLIEGEIPFQEPTFPSFCINATPVTSRAACETSPLVPSQAPSEVPPCRSIIPTEVEQQTEGRKKTEPSKFFASCSAMVIGEDEEEFFEESEEALKLEMELLEESRRRRTQLLALIEARRERKNMVEQLTLLLNEKIVELEKQIERSFAELDSTFADLLASRRELGEQLNVRPAYNASQS